MHTRWSWFVIALVFAFSLGFAADTYAAIDEEDDEDYEWRTWRTRRSEGAFNGHGAFFTVFNSFASDEVNDIAQAMGLDDLPAMTVGYGGYGMGHIGNGWRIGGMGFGSYASVDGVVTTESGRYNREIYLTMAGGGFMVEYAPFMIGPVNIGAGSMIGFGGMTLELRQDNGTFTWEDLVGQYTTDPATVSAENAVSRIDQGFFMVNPYVTARIHVLSWMAVEGAVGYHFDTSSMDNWAFFEDRELNGKGPDFNFHRPYFRVGLAFGG